MQAINLGEGLAAFGEFWSPKIVGAFNGHDLMVVKVPGEFVRHAHPDTDDFFMILSGQLGIDLPQGAVAMRPDEVFVVAAGVEPRPRADVETHVLLIEPQKTPNTGDPTTAVIKEAI